MNLIFICSPYKGNIEYNTNKVKGYCRFVYSKGNVPIAPHLHNPQFLDENIYEERLAGIKLGIELLKKCDEIWLFGNVLTEGMEEELKVAQKMKMPVRYFTDRCIERKEDDYE